MIGRQGFVWCECPPVGLAGDSRLVPGATASSQKRGNLGPNSHVQNRKRISIVRRYGELAMKRSRPTSAFTLLCLLVSAATPCAEFHVDPVGGADGNDGSSASPWKTLQTV